MSRSKEINRSITAAAGSALRPLGLLQKGRSRTWYDDRAWWLIIAEFQPSHNPGTYLNVSAMWLWVERDHWAFDEGSRLYWRDDGSFVTRPPVGEPGWSEHVGFVKPDQFFRDITVTAGVAAARIAELRAQFPHVGAVAESLTSRTTRPDESPLWHAYHAGVAAAICGDVTQARRQLTRVVPADPAAGWQRSLAAQASELLGLLDDRVALRERLIQTVSQTRQRLKLPVAASGWDETGF
ncbi:hypothetical protein [Micromonospora sp. C95]|uniref:hypothetical protein n=1 Tax=Micromonospora sp. C95 TaxID=2824882 RepID=UPI001B38A5CF|nr:hypothetical protein [Micromonospora sp. C95]MBQ1023882.1 hypothetical protein [Micromonospora sp. C95]